ncbi:MAG: hypothetical protein HY908_20690 [Myxococcales bacterium]|nr:hypothetical protein [Myxococcales bacterium]
MRAHQDPSERRRPVRLCAAVGAALCVAAATACGSTGKPALPDVTVEAARPSSAPSARPAAAAGIERPKTEEAWRTAKRIHVSGEGVLGCHGERLPAWARVVCDDAVNVFDAWPIGAAVAPEARDAGTAAVEVEVGKRAAVVFRWEPGARVTATFAWSGRTPVVFEASWPSGAEPPTLGALRGAPDISAEDLHNFVCACPVQGLAAAHACDLGGGLPLECLRTTYLAAPTPEACQLVRECFWAEPSSFAACLDGEEHDGVCPTCRCQIACGSKRSPCPPGTACVQGVRESICEWPEDGAR